MYPLYWTTSKGGIFMRYSYEFKRKAIELFYQGEWPKTPNGMRTDTFHRQIRDQVKLERLYGSQWVHKYKTLGYNGLINKPKGRPSKDCKMKVPKTISSRELKESEYEELVRLRAENAYIKAENEVIKKEIALREEKEAARLKAKKQRSSKRSANKAIN